MTLCTVCDRVILGDDLCPDGHEEACGFGEFGWCRCDQPKHKTCCTECVPVQVPGQLDLLEAG